MPACSRYCQNCFERTQRVYIHALFFLVIFCDFDRFAVNGIARDLAVGLVGTTFTNVVQSIVHDIARFPFGFSLGGADFNNLTIKFCLSVGATCSYTLRKVHLNINNLSYCIICIILRC